MSSRHDDSFSPPPAVLERRALARRRLMIQRRRTIAAGVLGALAIAAIAAVVSALGGGHAGGRQASAAGAPVLHDPRQLVPPQRLAAGENRAVDHVLSYTPYISHGSSHHHEIALTFDDGPGPYTSRVVHTLRKLHVPGTFFQVGQMIPPFRQAGREVRRWFPIGDHTFSHPQLGRLSKQQQRTEILGDVPRLRLEQVPTPRLFRPPYASFDRDTLALLRGARMLMVLWSIDSHDYLRPGTGVIVQRVVGQAKPGSIVLMHDAGGDRTQTIAALPAIVHKLRKRHYRFVTVPQMLGDAPPPRHQPLPPGAMSGGPAG